MTDYISRAAAAAEIARAYQDGRINTLEEILGVLDMLPAAEVEAVRSTWVPHGNIVYDLYQCNRCGHIIQEEDEILPEECPACHAGMEPHRRKRPPVTLPCEVGTMVYWIEKRPELSEKLGRWLISHHVGSAVFSYSLLKTLSPDTQFYLSPVDAEAALRAVKSKCAEDQINESALLRAELKTGDYGREDVRVCGSGPLVLRGLTLLILKVAEEIGVSYQSFCKALASDLPGSC